MGDRIHAIKVKGYSIDEKIELAIKHLIPNIENDLMINKLQQGKIEQGKVEQGKVYYISITSDAIKYIIINKTNNEEGVRKLKQLLEAIYRRVNRLCMIENINNYLIDDRNIKEILNDLIDSEVAKDGPPAEMYL